MNFVEYGFSFIHIMSETVFYNRNVDVTLIRFHIKFTKN